MSLRLLEDNEKVKLTADDLFDRIINLKIKLGKPAEGNEQAECLDEYVIRSDYEIVYSDVNINNVFDSKLNSRKYVIRKCTNKPSIKVQCNMVTANTGTSIDIYISNFFIFTADGQCLRSINSAKYPIVGVDIAMGYWGQFANTVDPNSDKALDQFFDIKAINGADMISLSSGNIYVTTDKLPPDSVLHIHGFVADIASSPVAVSEVTDYEKAVKNPSVTSDMKLSEILYNQITRRYVRGNRINKRTKSEDAETNPEVDKETGLMSDSYAQEYGVQVFLSKGAQEIKIEADKDSEGKDVKKTIYFESGLTIGQTIARLQSSVDTSFEYRFTNKGNILVYTVKESGEIQSLSKDFEELYKDSALTSVFDNALPAVYNINIDAVSTIVCPFFTFIEPFQKLKFASRYALTSLVDYYANYDATLAIFIAIRASLSFATVEDINEVQIKAVSVKGENNG